MWEVVILADIWIVAGYETAVIVFLAGLIQRLDRKRDLKQEFDGLYFVKWAFGLSFILQLVGFTLVVSLLFHNRQAAAVALTALIAMPGWLVVSAWMQWSFFRRYNRIPNLIKRLERMSPEERASHLESLPPQVFSQLPGDYRFVSRYSEPGKR